MQAICLTISYAIIIGHRFENYLIPTLLLKLEKHCVLLCFMTIYFFTYSHHGRQSTYLPTYLPTDLPTNLPTFRVNIFLIRQITSYI